VISVRLSADDLQLVDKVAKERSLSRSDALRELLRAGAATPSPGGHGFDLVFADEPRPPVKAKKVAAPPAKAPTKPPAARRRVI
jgi:hypothetical protein